MPTHSFRSRDDNGGPSSSSSLNPHGEKEEDNEEEGRDVCCVCLDDCDAAGTSRLPCGHIVHTVCLMNFCQYDTRCPICRETPSGVSKRGGGGGGGEGQAQEQNEEEEIDSALLTAVTWMRSEWRRYRRRRSRYIRNNPSLLRMENRLKELRDTMEIEGMQTRRMYQRKCREVWRGDSEIIERKRILINLRRREKRLERQLEAAVTDGIGGDPSPPTRRLLITVR